MEIAVPDAAGVQLEPGIEMPSVEQVFARAQVGQVGHGSAEGEQLGENLEAGMAQAAPLQAVAVDTVWPDAVERQLINIYGQEMQTSEGGMRKKRGMFASVTKKLNEWVAANKDDQEVMYKGLHLPPYSEVAVKNKIDNMKRKVTVIKRRQQEKGETSSVAGRESIAEFDASREAAIWCNLDTWVKWFGKAGVLGQPNNVVNPPDVNLTDSPLSVRTHEQRVAHQRKRRREEEQQTAAGVTEVFMASFGAIAKELQARQFEHNAQMLAKQNEFIAKIISDVEQRGYQALSMLLQQHAIHKPPMPAPVMANCAMPQVQVPLSPQNANSNSTP